MAKLKGGDQVYVLPSCPDWGSASRITEIVSGADAGPGGYIVYRMDNGFLRTSWWVKAMHIKHIPPPQQCKKSDDCLDCGAVGEEPCKLGCPNV